MQRMLQILAVLICMVPSQVMSGSKLSLDAKLSNVKVRAGEPVSLTVTVRNQGNESSRFCPFRRSVWPCLWVEFGKQIPVNPRGPQMEIGTLPDLDGIQAVVPSVLKPGTKQTATIDCLSWQFYVYREGAMDQTPLFIFPGTHRFRVAYRIDEDTAKAFGIAQTTLQSKELTLTVLPSIGKKVTEIATPDKWTDAHGKFIPHWMNLDGIYEKIPASTKGITPKQRKAIEASFLGVLRIAGTGNPPEFSFCDGIFCCKQSNVYSTLYQTLCEQTGN